MTVENGMAGQYAILDEGEAEKLTSNGPLDLLPRNRSSSDSLLQVVLQLLLELVAVADSLSKFLDGVEVLEEKKKMGRSVHFGSRRVSREEKRRV